MFKKILKSFLVIIAFIIIVIEDMFWDIVSPALKALDKFEIIKKISSYINNYNPYFVLLLYGILVVIISTISFMCALIVHEIIHNGYYIFGVIILISLKYCTTVIYAKAFKITENKLKEIFQIYYIICSIKEVLEKWHSTKLYCFFKKLYKKFLEFKESFSKNPNRFSIIKKFLKKQKKESI